MTLIPKILWLIFFFTISEIGQVIVIRVLMLDFETFYVDRPFHNIHKNVICAKI